MILFGKSERLLAPVSCFSISFRSASLDLPLQLHNLRHHLANRLRALLDGIFGSLSPSLHHDDCLLATHPSVVEGIVCVSRNLLQCSRSGWCATSRGHCASLPSPLRTLRVALPSCLGTSALSPRTSLFDGGLHLGQPGRDLPEVSHVLLVTKIMARGFESQATFSRTEGSSAAMSIGCLTCTSKRPLRRIRSLPHFALPMLAPCNFPIHILLLQLLLVLFFVSSTSSSSSDTSSFKSPSFLGVWEG